MENEKTVHIQARISKELREEFQKVAKTNAQNPSLLIRKWIENYVKESK